VRLVGFGTFRQVLRAVPKARDLTTGQPLDDLRYVVR
jgi:nucleoid DNA-binding protein